MENKTPNIQVTYSIPLDELLELCAAKIRSLQLSDDEPEIISENELCSRLNISKPTASTWRNRGRIPFIQIGSAIRYNYKEVLNALRQSKKSHPVN